MAVFKTFFLGRGLGACERACAASFAAHGHSLRLYTYDPLDVPAGVDLVDAATVIPRAEREAFFETAPGRISQFSNGFRYRLLKEQGGWWVDTDVMCRSEQVPNNPIVLGREHGDYVGTAIMRFPSDHPLLSEAEKSWRESWSVDTWAFSGPQLLTHLVKRFGLDQNVAPQHDLYPVAWPQALELFDPARRAEMERAIEGKPFLHAWLSVLPRHGLPRDSIPPPGSALRVLIDRYLRAEGCLAEGTFINDLLASLSDFKRVAEQSDREAQHAKKVTDLAINDVALERAHGERLTAQLDDAKGRAEELWVQLEDARVRVTDLSAQLDDSKIWVQKLSAQLDEARIEHERLKSAYDTAPSLPLRIGRKLGLGRLKRYIGNT